jgi:hypothetical protein
MKQLGKDILASVTVGVLLPAMILNYGAKVRQQTIQEISEKETVNYISLPVKVRQEEANLSLQEMDDYLVGVVLAVRLCAYGMAYLKYHMMAAIHTYLNKVTGALVFLIPYMLLLPCDVTLCAITAGFALVGSAEEFLIHAVSPVYQAERKSVFAKPVK